MSRNGGSPVRGTIVCMSPSDVGEPSGVHA